MYCGFANMLANANAHTLHTYTQNTTREFISSIRARGYTQTNERTHNLMSILCVCECVCVQVRALKLRKTDEIIEDYVDTTTA